jgi:lipocalin
MESFTYRGYQVYVVSDSCAWSFVARPTTPDLPILRRPTSGLHISRETALAEAKARIDQLLEV